MNAAAQRRLTPAFGIVTAVLGVVLILSAIAILFTRKTNAAPAGGAH